MGLHVFSAVGLRNLDREGCPLLLSSLSPPFRFFPSSSSSSYNLYLFSFSSFSNLIPLPLGQLFSLFSLFSHFLTSPSYLSLSLFLFFSQVVISFPSLASLLFSPSSSLLPLSTSPFHSFPSYSISLLSAHNIHSFPITETVLADPPNPPPTFPYDTAAPPSALQSPLGPKIFMSYILPKPFNYTFAKVL